MDFSYTPLDNRQLRSTLGDIWGGRCLVFGAFRTRMSRISISISISTSTSTPPAAIQGLWENFRLLIAGRIPELSKETNYK